MRVRASIKFQNCTPKTKRPIRDIEVGVGVGGGGGLCWLLQITIRDEISLGTGGGRGDEEKGLGEGG